MSRLGDYMRASFIAADFSGETEEDTITNLALEVLRLRRLLGKEENNDVDIL